MSVKPLFYCAPFALGLMLGLATHATAQGQLAVPAPAVNLQGARSYAVIETAFDWPDFAGDPFDYIKHDVRVAVKTPGGKTLSLPAFFDGGTTWRARHTPDAPGVYRVVGIFDNGKKLDLRAQTPRWNVGAKLGATDKSASDWVRIDARNPRRFSLPDGARFYPFGMNQAWTGGEQKGYEAKFTELQNAHLNWSRIWMNYWDGKDLMWRRDGKLPIGDIDLEAARRWDSIIQSADRHDVYVQMTIQHHGQYSLKVNPNWNENPWNAKNGGFLNAPGEFFTDARARELTKRKLRYIVARYGYSPHIMAWELWNEVQFTAPGQDNQWDGVAAWHREMTDFLRAQDAYHHLITTSSDAPPAVYAPVDYYQYHSYPIYQIPALSRAHFEGQKWPAKPWFVGEFGPDNSKDRPDEWTLHSGVWAGLMSDAAGAAQYWEGDRVERDNLYFHFAAASAFLKQSDFGRHDAQSPTQSAPIVIATPEKTDLKLTFNGGWGAAKQSEFDLSDADAIAAFGQLPSYFQGDNHRDLNPVPLRIKLDLPEPGVLKLTLAQVAKAGAHLRVVSSGAIVDYPLPATEEDTKPNRVISIPVEAGPQTVTLENSGQDWIMLGDLSVPDAAPTLDGRARANDDWMMGWFYNRAGIEAATPPGLAPNLAGGTATIETLAAGDYRVTWWDTLASKPLKTVTVRADNHGLKLQIPSIARDIAVWAQRVK